MEDFPDLILADFLGEFRGFFDFYIYVQYSHNVSFYLQIYNTVFSIDKLYVDLYALNQSIRLRYSLLLRKYKTFILCMIPYKKIGRSIYVYFIYGFS